jgi:hypothetical protein|tara:strand:- start:142 stop:534 length:393 start_codon:yes stop_codon:yes gene_type:complete
MASNVRFVDSLKVGAYDSSGTGGGGGGITINNNVNNYILSATGNPDIINGEANLQFDGTSLGIGGASTGPRLEIIDNNTGEDLLLIRNADSNGVRITSGGILQLIEFSSLPTAVEGGIVYNSDEFYVGLG